MTPFIVLYLLIFVVVAVVCGIGVLVAVESGDEVDKRLLSRIVLLSPVWPLALIGLTIWSIKPLWKLSGWGK